MSHTSASDSPALLSNPFSSRHIRPGAQAFIFPANESIDQCVARLREYSRSQIVGPHGAGKSTLMREIIRVWVEQGGSASLWRIGPRHRIEERLVWEPESGRATSRETLVCVDGWDAWRWWRRVACRWQLGARQRLLVTTHVDNGWPILFQPKTELSAFRNLVAQLQGDSRIQASNDEIESAFCQCDGNVREALFALYDVIQRKSLIENCQE